MIKIDSKFNLLSPTRQPLSFAEKIYNWALSFGRYLIIGTELVVLVAFAARFKLDYDISDQTERIENASDAVALLEPLEDKYNTVFDKLNAYDQISAVKTNPGDELDHLASLASAELTFQTINYSETEVTLIGETTSLCALATYELSLQKETVVYHTQHPDELVPIRYDSVTVTKTQAGAGKDTSKFIIKVNLGTI